MKTFVGLKLTMGNCFVPTVLILPPFSAANLGSLQGSGQNTKRQIVEELPKLRDKLLESEGREASCAAAPGYMSSTAD